MNQNGGEHWAFPSESVNGVAAGLSKRELYAVAAMQALIVARNYRLDKSNCAYMAGEEEIADWAIKQADALASRLGSA